MSRNEFLMRFLIAVLMLAVPVGAASAQNPSKGAAALIESIEGAPSAGVGFLDYVYPGQVIDLGSSGVVVLSYFDSCLLETVRGGRVTVEAGASKVSNGTVSIEKVPCQGTQMFVTVETSEAGATVNRISEEGQDDWSEWTVKSAHPMFKWQPAKAAGESEISVFDMDVDPPKLVWQTRTEAAHVEYPATAPELKIGLPYRVSVRLADGIEIAAVFSIDPDLEVPDTAVSRLVPVRHTSAP